ncbi:uncharacterized protein TNCV_2101131 [Trichonephila clavipes]|nr:uncharacterized protein TNCV_2101131 [Trichonephila clavipes]
MCTGNSCCYRYACFSVMAVRRPGVKFLVLFATRATKRSSEGAAFPRSACRSLFLFFSFQVTQTEKKRPLDIGSLKDCAARATFGSDSIRTLDLPLPLYPSKLLRGRGKGPVSGSRCQSIIVLVVGIFDSYYLCRCRGHVCVCQNGRQGSTSNSKGTPTKKAKRVCHYNVDRESSLVWLNKCDEDNTKGYCKLCKNSFTVAYDGLKAVTHHAEAKKHKECESAAAMSHRMKSFFTPKSSAQSEKVGIAELTEIYHSIKHHIFYVAQDCSLKVLKQVVNDSDIVKQKMTGGRTKCTALVNQVLFPYSMELVQEDLKNDVPFSVVTDASNKDSFEDSTSIKERLCEVMDKSRLPWSRVTAYGADNASVNFGVNNSVFQKLKSEENNNIIAAHCNDHIFHNCAKNALKVMPVDVENIVMKVFAEFSCSAKKREDLKGVL